MKRLVVSVARVGDTVRARFDLCATCSQEQGTTVLASTGCFRHHHLVGQDPDLLPSVTLKIVDNAPERA